MQNQPSQYDFIMSPGQTPKKTLLPGMGSSKKQRILIIGAGGGLVLVILAIIFSLVLGSGGGNTDDLVLAVQQQTELIRVSNIALTKAKSREALNLAITTKLALTTEQQPLLKLIKSQGRKVDAKVLAGGKNTKTDQTLGTASDNNKFDEVFVTTLQTGLANYQKTLKKAYDGTQSKNVKQSISDAYNQAKVLFPPQTEQSS